jgi:hypothetical protein
VIEDFRHNRLTEFDGLPIFHFAWSDPEEIEDDGIEAEDGGIPAEVGAWAWRVGADEYESPTIDRIFGLFLETVDTTAIKALVIGHWAVEDHEYGEPPALAELLVPNAGRFPALEALFIGDMSSEEAEVSWIVQSDPGPIVAAFPNLRVLGIRGTTGLTVEPMRHDRLSELTFQGGGLAPAVVRALGESELPALAGLDLYLGTDEYGGGVTPEDLDAVLSGTNLPALRHLGLRNAENADEIAEAVATAPIVAQLESLDLSLGSLTDVGAEALLAGQPLSHLKSLDLHHHFLSDEMLARLREALPGVELGAAEQLTMRPGWPDETQLVGYVAVSE